MSASLDQFRSEYDEESLGMLSDILSTLYQNPERSVLREYIANGIDAHKISGYNGPVEVTLPGPARPTLVIRDHGDGLSREDMQRVYFSYVRSTKRDDDNQIGALGLGAKSAFALTKSWTVTNVHNGLKYVVASVNDDYGAPQQTVLVNGEPTDEDSGITVTIPISERHLTHRWAETAASLTLWLPKGAVSINGHVPNQHWTNETSVYGNSIRTNAGTYNSREFNVFQAIMGGIGYVVDDLTKETVRHEAEALILAEKYDTAEVLDAMNTHPKASLQKDTNYGINNVTVDDREKNLARMGHAHASLRSALLSSVMSRPIKVDLGDVDFMPSRESVKGTPRTISALSQAVADTVSVLSKDILAARTQKVEGRIDAARSISRNSGANDRETLTAVGVHDTDTDVFSIGVGGARLGAHTVILGGSNSRVLVTGISGTALYKGKMYARARRVSVYVTEKTPPIDSYIGDLRRYFTNASGESGVMTHEKFKSIVAEEFPANRGGVDTRHDVVITTGDGFTDRDMIPFSELEDTLDGVDKVYVCDEAPYHSRLKTASLFGIKMAVVVRGRRKFETFVKTFGEGVVAEYSKAAADIDAQISSAAKNLVRDSSKDDIRRVILARSESAKDTVTKLQSIFDSTSGALIPQDHRARRFYEDFIIGTELVSTPAGAKLHTALLLEEHDAAHGRESVMSTVDTAPWVLLTDMRRGAGEQALTHAAMYVAAVG